MANTSLKNLNYIERRDYIQSEYIKLFYRVPIGCKDLNSAFLQEETLGASDRMQNNMRVYLKSRTILEMTGLTLIDFLNLNNLEMTTLINMLEEHISELNTLREIEQREAEKKHG